MSNIQQVDDTKERERYRQTEKEIGRVVTFCS
jgi:hypothetical protein